MIVLSIEQVKQLHKKLLNTTGGLDGIRDENSLDSAVSSAFQTFDGIELYPSVIAKIARIAYGIVINHPFADGNKRTGTYVMMILLELNGIKSDFTNDDVIRIGLELASGNMEYKQLLNLILERLI